MRKRRSPPSGRVRGLQGAARRALNGGCVPQGPRGTGGRGRARLQRLGLRSLGGRRRRHALAWCDGGGSAAPSGRETEARCGAGRRPRAAAGTWTAPERRSAAPAEGPVPTPRPSHTPVDPGRPPLGDPWPSGSRGPSACTPHLPQSCSHSRTRPSAHISPSGASSQDFAPPGPRDPAGRAGTALTVTHLPPDPPRSLQAPWRQEPGLAARPHSAFQAPGP